MWICKMCETSNEDHLTRCAACGAVKPANNPSVSGSRNTGTSRASSANAAGTGSPSGAASAPASKSSSSLSIWIVIALIAAAIYYFTAGGGDPMALYREVMAGNMTFISGDTGASAAIHETYKCFKYDARHGQPTGFLLADVDNDNKDEVVVSLSEDGYRLVLDAQGSNIYGYLFSFRGMKSVHADGTFESSSSADNSGYYYADFNGRGYGISRVSTYTSSPEKYFMSFNESNIKTYVK